MKKMFDLNLGMTQTISHFSRYSDEDKYRDENTGEYIYTEKKIVNAAKKIHQFYVGVFWCLGLSALALFILTNVDTWFIGAVRDSVQQETIVPTEITPTDVGNE